jgi:hypothetical protein
MPEGFQPEGFVSKASSLPLPTGCALRTIASRLEAPLYITHPEPTPSLRSEKHTHTQSSVSALRVLLSHHIRFPHIGAELPNGGDSEAEDHRRGRHCRVVPCRHGLRAGSGRTGACTDVRRVHGRAGSGHRVADRARLRLPLLRRRCAD